MNKRKNYKVLGKLPHGLYLIRSTCPRSKKFNCLTEDGKLISKRRWFNQIVTSEGYDSYFGTFNNKVWEIRPDGSMRYFVDRPYNAMSPIVKYINDNLETNDGYVCHLLTSYMHGSYMYMKQNMDGSWLRIQPGWPEYNVVGYRFYYDNTMKWAHKSGRMVVVFDNNTETEISLYKFKRYARRLDYWNRQTYYRGKDSMD